MTPKAGQFLAMTGARLPLVQAPMANFAGPALAIAAIRAGAVGSLACAALTPEKAHADVALIRGGAEGPLNLNFFAHRMPPAPDESAWREALAPFYEKEGVAPPETPPPLRRPFDAAMADMVAEVRPEIVSFHFGLPDPALVERVRATGALIIGNATNGIEAAWLGGRGCHMIVAQGFEAGGHAGHFMGSHRPVGQAALTRQLVSERGGIPIIAAGGIAEESAARAAMALGAAAIQVGTAYLPTPESLASELHRRRLADGGPEDTAFTNVFTGGLARGLRNRLTEEMGAVSAAAPPFPYASAALAPLRAKAEAEGRDDYSPLWAGQGLRHIRAQPAEELTRRLGEAALNGN